MTPYYFVTAARTSSGVKFSSYSDFDDALRGAHSMLSNGAIAAWILDRNATLILPAEQVKLRLKMQDQHPSGP